MKSFYGHLRAGDSKDTALQKAQLAMIHGPAETSAPFHWAAFQLAGEARLAALLQLGAASLASPHSR